jgi:hypothetical protein
VKGAKKYGESGQWIPAYFRMDDEKIHSGNALMPAWWGNRIGKSIQPLYLPETAKAYELVKDIIKDDNGDGKPEANTRAEIKAMLEAISKTLKGGRFKTISSAYVKGDKVWEIKKGGLATSKHEQATPLNWAFSHNISPANKALGVNGCTDCHGTDSSFFNSPVITDPYDITGKQTTMPMWRYIGISKNITLAQ